ncbi:MAG TPA: M20/M25/M40 family metallo-hydrolase [Nannocystis sp.]
MFASACPAPQAGETAPPVVRGEPASVALGVPPPTPGAASEPRTAVVGADKPALPAATVVSGVPPSTPLPPEFVAAAEKITAAAQGRTRAWELLAVLVDSFGHRLSGSRALEKAIDWSIEQMKRDGLVNARREKVMVPRWVRGRESARVVAPIERDLVVLGLGGTVGGKVRGEIVVVESLEEIQTVGEGLRGKIVVINQAMPPFDHASNRSFYGETVRIRSSGASAAAKFGAKAVLIRSVTANSLRSPHTGAVRYEEGVPKIPAAALTLEDAELLARLARRGPTRVELSLGAKTLPDSESGNAIAELRGRELPDEIVLIGGHIDSWDVGDGSTDDGAGCIMAMEAAALLKELGLVPRRTIRVVLFTNEENGLRGARAYHAAHGKEKHVAAIEADSGSGAPRGFGITGTPEEFAELQRYAPLFEALGASTFETGGGGADISPLTKDGVLSLGLHPDTSGYFDLHHSPADTFDKIDPDHLQRNAAAMALMAYILAER